MRKEGEEEGGRREKGRGREEREREREGGRDGGERERKRERMRRENSWNKSSNNINNNVLGASDYARLFLEQRNDFLDVLSAFPSCQPLLPRLIGTHL